MTPLPSTYDCTNDEDHMTPEEAAKLFDAYGGVGPTDQLLKIAPTEAQLSEATNKAYGKVSAAIDARRERAIANVKESFAQAMKQAHEEVFEAAQVLREYHGLPAYKTTESSTGDPTTLARAKNAYDNTESQRRTSSNEPTGPQQIAAAIQRALE